MADCWTDSFAAHLVISAPEHKILYGHEYFSIKLTLKMWSGGCESGGLEGKRRAETPTQHCCSSTKHSRGSGRGQRVRYLESPPSLPSTDGILYYCSTRTPRRPACLSAAQRLAGQNFTCWKPTQPAARRKIPPLPLSSMRVELHCLLRKTSGRMAPASLVSLSRREARQKWMMGEGVRVREG